MHSIVSVPSAQPNIVLPTPFLATRFAVRPFIAACLMMVWPTLGLGSEKPAYVIAHMANTEAAVDWAAARGANGVEADLRFDETGKPLEFRHGGICDCFCAFGRESICSALRTNGAACEASAAPAALLGRQSEE